MKFRLLSFSGVLFLALAAAAPADGESKQGYNAFRWIRSRDIFDPDRVPGKTAQAAASSRPSTSTAPAAHAQSIRLTGTMITAEKTLAFFSGTQTEFNIVATVREKIGDFTLLGISASEVELERDGKRIVLGVGKQLSLDGTVSNATTPLPASTPPPATADGKPAAAAPAAADGKDNLLRRMMERRQKEMTK